MKYNSVKYLIYFMLMLCITSFFTEAKAAPKYSSFSLDAITGKTLHNNNGYQLRYPASLTKVMTLYLVFEDLEKRKIQKSDLIIFSRNASRKPASKLGISEGESISVSNAIKALAVKSANDVATAIAEYLEGSEEKFALRMTEKAKDLGMINTTFKNASGLHNNHQKTTAFDMAILALRMLKDYPDESKVFALKEFNFEGQKYVSHNKLLFNYSGTKGMKTGYTSMSGFNLISYVERDRKKIISIVMGGSSSHSRNSNMVKVLNKSFKMEANTIHFPKMNPYLNRKKNQMNEDSEYLIYEAKNDTSRFDRLSDRVDKILSIFP